MFFVFNKEKIYSYIVALSTVIVLFITATVLSNMDNNTLPTSAKASKDLPIYSVNCEENKVSLTMNCAWNADDIDSILDTLSKYKTHITFFMVGDWVQKYPEAVKKIADSRA